ncbi:MAG: FAD-binding protein [Bacteroidota bacterium]|nr:FAD-binding protein [Bacteroidota bacterium]
MKLLPSFILKLRNNIQGDVYADDLQLGIYASDASNYQIKPICIVLPKNERDVILTTQIAAEAKIPILARGGGTSLNGQTVGEAIIIDFTKYMNRLLELDVTNSTAWVEPGIVRDVLNDELKIHKLHFAPDPATTSRAAIGGMIANNSSGTRSILYGKTLDHVIELKILLSDGSIIHCRNVNSSELEQKLEQHDREGEIYRGLFKIVADNRQEIIDRFPKVMRRVGGYNLDEFLINSWNLSKIIIGSEGTLGIILKAKLTLVPTPAFQAICVVHFTDFFESISHIQEIVNFKPVAVELLDDMLIQRSRENIETKRYCGFIEGNPGGALIVEFFGDSADEVKDKADELAAHLAATNTGYAWPVFTDKTKIEEVFTLRKKGLGLLMGVKGLRKPIAFIEDAAVPLEHLADYIREVFQVCKKYETPVVAYAHASVGLLHVKPLLDLRDAEDIERMKYISNDVLELVIKYKGSWSGEHGDGLARSPYNEKFFGTKLYQAFIQLKNLFDPIHILNPGKIVNAPPVDSNMRYGKDYADRPYNSMFHYREEEGFHQAIHLCNGVGECRKLSGGTMCPSYRATMEEKDSTRGRANALRLALSGQLDNYGLDSPALMDVMDLCLSCKACKAECPSNVDMSKLKSEILFHQHRKNGHSLADTFILMQDWMGKTFSGIASNAINPVLRNKLFRLILEKTTGLDRRRILPEYTNNTLFQRRGNHSVKQNKTVVLFADTYIKYHHPEIGISAKKLLEQLGYHVVIFNSGCCQRPAISKGLLNQAKNNGGKTMLQLENYLENNIPILICEPSCATALKDDVPDLLDNKKWVSLSENIWLIEDFITHESTNGNITSPVNIKPGQYLLHGHCHQKAMFTTSSIHQIFKANDTSTIQEIDSGCCGMAGSFGYEKNHYDISEKIGNQSLIPAIKNASPDSILIADGFSCRHQIEHFTGKKAIHWVEAAHVN